MKSASNSTATVLLVSTLAAIAVISFTKFKGNPNDSDKQSSSHNVTVCDRSPSSHRCSEDKPMFDFENRNLIETVLSLATQRAKRWMSFSVDGCSRMMGQVGGKSSQKRPLLTMSPNFVLKPISLDHRGVREIAFYEAVEASSAKNRSISETYSSLFGPRNLRTQSTSDLILSWIYGSRIQSANPDSFCEESTIETETKLLSRLELFIPEYFGVVEYTFEEAPTNETSIYGTNNNMYILLHNITSHFSKPSVLDLKMGTETFEPDAPKEKKLREASKYPSQTDFGFRLVAMRIYSPDDIEADEQGYVSFPKQFGRSLGTLDAVKRALRRYFGALSSLPKDVKVNRAKAIKRILTRLKLIKKWFKDNSVFAFCASSILLTYEGGSAISKEDGVQADLGTANMIDFGRVRRRPEGDLGYLKGLRNLISIVEDILTEDFWTDEYHYRFIE